MSDDDRKRRGAWFTPPAIVEQVVDAVIDQVFVDRFGDDPIRVVDPACGDGRFLEAAARRIDVFGGVAEVTGVDIDDAALSTARASLPHGRFVLGDALVSTTWGDAGGDHSGEAYGRFDLVVGNPPYLSQMATATTRGGSSSHGGGPYADAAVEFLALAADLVRADGGRLAFVLPQSLLAARDADPVRRRIDERAEMIWSSWTGERDFDAQVLTCALAFEFGSSAASRRGGGNWAHVVTERLGIPPMPSALDVAAGDGVTLGDLGRLNANFRDEYYGMIPAVDDHDDGPPLVTSGLIDPGVCLWGVRPVRFAKRRFDAPRVDLDALDARMRAWAQRRLAPKVLVANQTSVLEAVCDPEGKWLPGVPVVSIYPLGDRDSAGRLAWEIAAVLTSPAASAWAWHQRGGTGMSASAIRVGPTMLAALPWPVGDMDTAVAALQAGDVIACGQAVDRAYGIGPERCDDLASWWNPIVERIGRRTR